METGTRLGNQTTRIGYYAITGSDEAFTAPSTVFRRIGAEDEPTITVITGSEVRDWAVSPRARAFFPARMPSIRSTSRVSRSHAPPLAVPYHAP